MDLIMSKSGLKIGSSWVLPLLFRGLGNSNYTTCVSVSKWTPLNNKDHPPSVTLSTCRWIESWHWSEDEETNLGSVSRPPVSFVGSSVIQNTNCHLESVCFLLTHPNVLTKGDLLYLFLVQQTFANALEDSKEVRVLAGDFNNSLDRNHIELYHHPTGILRTFFCHLILLF